MSILVNSQNVHSSLLSFPRHNQNFFSDLHSFTSLLSSFSAAFLTSAFHLSHICSFVFSTFSSFSLLNSSETGGYGDVCHELLPRPSFRDLQYSRRRERLRVLSARRASVDETDPSLYSSLHPLTSEKDEKLRWENKTI